MGLEGFAELSTLLLPGWSVLSIEDVRFMEPFKFYRGEPRTVRLAARFSPEGEQLLARCVLSGERRLAGKSEPVASTAFTATVRLGRSVPAEPASAAAELPPAPSGPELRAEQVYQVYFHGPAYRVLDGAWTGTPGTVVGRLADRLPPNHEPRELPTRIAPRLIELCFQTAGVFELGVDERFGLPSRVTRVEKLHEVDPADRPYYSIVRRHGDDFDADVVDRNGTVCLRLSGYHTTELPGAAGKLPIGPIKAAIGAY
jgi:hypothetical protein